MHTLPCRIRLGIRLLGVARNPANGFPARLLGTIEVGKLADVIVVRQNPLEDIDNLRSLEMVFKEGVLVADHRREVG